MQEYDTKLAEIYLQDVLQQGQAETQQLKQGSESAAGMT